MLFCSVHIFLSSIFFFFSHPVLPYAAAVGGLAVEQAEIHKHSSAEARPLGLPRGETRHRAAWAAGTGSQREDSAAAVAPPQGEKGPSSEHRVSG